MSEFSKKNYIVVGASSGIGKAIASQLAEKGANIALVSKSTEKLENTLFALSSGNHRVFQCNIAVLQDIQTLVSEIKAQYEIIDGLVFCVGEGRTAKLKDLAVDDMTYAMNASCFSFLEFVKQLNKKPKSQPLRIVAISSLASMEFQKYLTLYAAAKAALEASIRCLSSELGPRNVRINAIRPAFVDTPRLGHLNEITGNIEESLKKNTYQPLGLIKADDVASLALYLLSEDANCINGVSWPINGGASC